MGFRYDYFKECLETEYTVVGDGISYAIKRSGGHLRIYFQGSHEASDWKNNFRFWAKVIHKTPYKNMPTPYKVHAGFLDCWKQVEDIIGGLISDLSVTAITIIGYSHGAALALLCHEYCYFHRADLRSSGLMTHAFEAPRVYAKFRKADREELLKRWEGCAIYRNSDDIVTHMPFKWMGYMDVGYRVQIGLYPYPSMKKKNYGFPSCVKAHYPANVLESVKEYEARLEEAYE